MSNEPMFDENELVQSVLEGNEYAYKRFVKQYERLVFHVIVKLIDREEDVEDLAQEVFMKVFKNLSGFKFQSKLSTWIVQIAYRDAINYLKKTKRYSDNKVDIDQVYSLADSAPNPEQINVSKDLSTLVNEAIKKLPEHYREVLVLYHLKEFSYPEIGEITGMPEGTVKNYIFRARKLLKEYLEPYVKREQL
ncbi:RNA polymerase sigma factor [Arcticibacterium luteifluviistationis]|nr:RNA polymerase sigma factor [Arcticibacterium luteifluviistationis]